MWAGGNYNGSYPNSIITNYSCNYPANTEYRN